jgi:chromosome segregation ATPase
MSNTINKNATLVFRVDGSDESKQQIDKLRTSLEGYSDAGKQVAQSVTDSLTNIGREFDKLTQRETEGKNITTRELSVMVQQFNLLKQAIVNSFGSLDAAPAELQRAYAAAGQQVDLATEKVRNASAAMKNHASEVSEAGARWGGFKEAIKDAFPQLSSFIAKAGEIGGAFGAGLAIGQQFNAFLKTDMSEWNSLMEQVSTRANAIIRAIADELVAIGVVMKDVVTFNIQEIGRDTDILKQTTAQGFKTMKEAVSDTGTEWDKYAKTIGVATESGKAAAETAAKLAEEKRKLSEELKKVVLSLQQENIELQKQKLLKEDAELALVNETSNLGYYKRNVDETSSALADQNRKLQGADAEVRRKRSGRYGGSRQTAATGIGPARCAAAVRRDQGRGLEVRGATEIRRGRDQIAHREDRRAVERTEEHPGQHRQGHGFDRHRDRRHREARHRHQAGRSEHRHVPR